MATFEIKVIACDKYLRWSMRFNATIPAKPYHFLILYFSQWAPWYWLVRNPHKTKYLYFMAPVSVPFMGIN
jgi:hypothetical protein